MESKRSLAIGLCAVAALCLLYSAFTRHWLVNSSTGIDIGFGLRSSYECGGAECTYRSNSDVNEEFRRLEDLSHGEKLHSSAFVPMGWVTFVDLLVAVAGLLAAVGIAAAKKKPQLPIAPTTVALLGIMIGLITGCVFVATKPGPNGMVGVGVSFWLFGVGCVMGIAGAQLMAKVNRPPDPDLMADAMNPDHY
jgi:hypothetical protein